MPEIALDIPFVGKLIPHAVAETAIENEQQKGIYIPVYCPIREEATAYIFHRTARTDFDGRVVYVLVGIQSLNQLAQETVTTLASMKPVGSPS